MRPSTFAPALSAATLTRAIGASAILCAVVIAWFAGTAMAAPDATSNADAQVAAGPSENGVFGWLASSYEQSPATVLALAALIVVSSFVVLGFLARRRDAGPVALSEARTQVRRVARPAASVAREAVRTGHIPLRPVEAWVEVVEPAAAAQRYQLSRMLLRIGRETDNDVCLEERTVHRYHAAIHRTEDAEFVITDLSSAGGNGVVVNGRPVTEARLAHGDLIELGTARLKFSAAPGNDNS